MSKQSKHVWVVARASMDIPDLEGFSEPHFADLLFSKRCHGKVRYTAYFCFFSTFINTGAELRGKQSNESVVRGRCSTM